MTEVDELRERVDRIEHEDIKKINGDLVDIKLDLKENNILTKQSVESNQKLTETMDCIKEAMGEMTLSLRESNKVTAELSNRMSSFENKLVKTNEKMDEKFNELKQEVESVDDKSKVDIITWARDNWYKIIVGIVLSGLVIEQIVGINPAF